jgi:hypothetical protein
VRLSVVNAISKYGLLPLRGFVSYFVENKGI